MNIHFFLRSIASFFLKSQEATWEVFASICQNSLGISPFRDFLQATAAEEHPFFRFDVGNLDTLGAEVLNRSFLTGWRWFYR